MADEVTFTLQETGVRAAACLYGSKAGEDSLKACANTLFDGFAGAVNQLSIYISDGQGQLTEVFTVDHETGVIINGDTLPVNQLPTELLSKNKAVRTSRHQSYETWLPLVAEALIGLITLSSLSPLDDITDDQLHMLSAILSLGMAHYLYAQETERNLNLFRSVTLMSRRLEAAAGPDQILQDFVSLLVELTGFDRGTLFMFREGTTTVWRAIHCRVGRPVVELRTPPPLPRIELDKLQELSVVPGLWIPIYSSGYLAGGLLVDNLFSHDAVPAQAAQALEDLSGQVILALQNAALVERLNELAIRDDLTGLYRPGFFHTAVRDQFDRLKTSGEPCGFLTIDVDQFKTINDTYGHAAGDAVLIQVANLITETVREPDLAGRMGGDEFAVFLPGIASEEGVLVAKRVLSRLQNNEFILTNERKVRLTVSVGASFLPEDGDNLDDIIRRSDEAMYVSKRKGRSRVSMVRDATP